jgi:DNA-binding response OmpR family regulator
VVDPSDQITEFAARPRVQGYTVTEARSGGEGARMALNDPPSAVVADLWMPVVLGVQLCRLLRAEVATSHVPIVLRGVDGQRNRYWAGQAGAADYVAKGRIGDVVRTLARAIASTPPHVGLLHSARGD